MFERVSFPFVVLSIVLLFFPGQHKVFAQTSTLDQSLYHSGFDRVESSIIKGKLYLSLENRSWLSDTESIVEILTIINESVVQFDRIHVQLKNYDIPLITIESNRADLKLLLKENSNYHTWLKNSRFIFSEESFGGSKAAFPVSIDPVLDVGLNPRYQLGNFNNKIRLGLEITPELTALLPFGVRFRGGIGLPVYNDLDQNRTVRLSHLSLTRQFQVQPGLYGGVSVGFFSRNRAGAHIQFTQYLWDERFSFTYQGGYTRFSSAMGAVDDLFVEDQPYVVSTVAAEYRWKKYHLDLNIEYGQFLYYDSGYKVDVQRYFGETIIGMFVLQTRRGTNYGFHVSIPLFPRKGARVSGLMVRSASHVPFSYRYEGNDLKGRMYRTGIDYPTRLKRVYPSYLMDELEPYFWDN